MTEDSAPFLGGAQQLHALPLDSPLIFSDLGPLHMASASQVKSSKMASEKTNQVKPGNMTTPPTNQVKSPITRHLQRQVQSHRICKDKKI